MPKGYWIVRVDIADPEKYKEYIAANGPPTQRDPVAHESMYGDQAS